MTIDNMNNSIHSTAGDVIVAAEAEIIALTENLSGDITDDNKEVTFTTDSHDVATGVGEGKDSVSLTDFMKYSGKASRKVQGATDAQAKGKEFMQQAARAVKNN